MGEAQLLSLEGTTLETSGGLTAGKTSPLRPAIGRTRCVKRISFPVSHLHETHRTDNLSADFRQSVKRAGGDLVRLRVEKRLASSALQ